MERSHSEKNDSENKDVFLLGGKDLEMYQIEKRLKRAGREYVNRNLQWGASIDDYNDEIQKIISEGKTPVAVELAGADKVEGVVDIDHHGEKFSRPASIVQVMNRLGKEVGLVDEMIAANDSGYIPGMMKKMEEYRAALEERYGHEKFEQVKKKLIDLIRRKDREMQGVTLEMEAEAKEAIIHAEHGPNGLLIVRINGSKPSPVNDMLFPSWESGEENLLVICKNNEGKKDVYYFGSGDICKEVKETYSGWGGGVGYGQKGKKAFGGASSSNPQEIIDLVISKNIE